MEEIKFTSINDLYRRILPALKSKKKELTRSGLAYIKEEDIWNFLKTNRWNKSSNLLLNEMVNDILNTSNEDIDDYVKKKIGNFSRTIIDSSDTLL